MSRKRFQLVLLSLAILAAALVLTRRAFSSTELLYRVQEVKPKIFTWTPEDVINQECDPLYDRPANSGFIVGTQGVIVVDTSNSPMNARDILYEIRQHTDQQVRYVVNTSGEPDHFLGNEVFTFEQVAIISSKAAQARMQQYMADLVARMHVEDGYKLQARMRGFHLTLASHTFNKEMVLNVGGQEVRISTMPPGDEKSADSIVSIPGEKVVFLGELFDNQYFPRVGKRDVHRWIDMLKQMEDWDVDVFVPAHGNPGTKKDVADFRKFLEWAVAQVEMRLKNGESPVDIKKNLHPERTYTWHARERAADTVADIARQLAPADKSNPPSFP